MAASDPLPPKELAPDSSEQSRPNSDAAAPASEKSESLSPPAEKPLPPGMHDIPDGGLQAWLQVLGAFMLFFNTWGILNTFGVFQTYYESGALFKETSSDIAWIGAIQAFLLLSLGTVSGPLYDRGYLRPLIIGGSFFTVFGYMMLSICKTFWQVVLTQGFCIGIGGGMIFIPSVAILPTYFKKRLGLAVGLAASGSSMGGVIYPIVFYRLIDQIGFGWSTRVLGFIGLGTLLIPLAVMKQRIKPAKPRDFIDWTAFTDWPYLIFIFGCIIGFIGLYSVLFYISYFAEQQHITDTSLSFYLIPILNAASVFGRTLPNYVSDYVGTLNIVGPGALICGILIFCMLAISSVGGIVTIAVLFGFFSGVFIALPPVCLAILTTDKSKIGTRIGMGFAIISVSVLCGGPGSGAILGKDVASPKWTDLWIYGGVCSVGAGVVFMSLRMWKAGGKFAVKL